MMQLYYGVKDVSADEFLTIFPAVNDSVAIRNFKVYISSLPEIIRGDLELYCINVFDTRLGTFGDFANPHKVEIGGDDIVKEE